MSFLEKITKFLNPDIEQKSFFEQIIIGLNRTSVSNTNINKALKFYATHELVYACVNKIADVMNDAELVVEKRNIKGEWEKIEGHPLIALLNKPNAYELGEEFNRIRIQSEYVAGISYFEKIYSKAKILVELEPINPTTITAKLNQNKTEIAEYVIQTGAKRRTLLPEQVLIRRRADLTNLFSGLSPAQVAMKTINADIGMAEYIQAFFDNDGTPSGILKVLNKSLKETQAESLAAKWRKKFGRGGNRQKGIAVLDQDADFQKLGSNLSEIESDATTFRNQANICSVFGVPPILVSAYVGLKFVNQRASAKEALQDFIINKISPELKTYRKWLTWYLLSEFENIELIKQDKIRVNFDLSQVGYLQEEVDKIHDRVRKDFAIGLITQNEARAETKRLPAPDGDRFVWELKQPQQMIFPTVQEEPTKALKLLPEKKTFDLDGLVLGREPRGVELLIDLKKMVNDAETVKQKASKILYKFREQLINEAIKELENFDISNVYQLTLSPNKKINSQLYKVFEASYNLGRKQIIEEIIAQENAKNFYGFTLELKELDDSIIKKLLEITDLTVSKILNEIQKRTIDLFVVLTGLNAENLLKTLKERLSGESTKWVDQRAGNSTNLLIQSGRDAEIENNSDKIEYIEYSAILDKNTCPSCENADGQTSDNINNLPAVPNASCDGGENCRCFHVAVIV